MHLYVLKSTEIMKSMPYTDCRGNLGRAVVDNCRQIINICCIGIGEDSPVFDMHPNKSNIETEFVNLTHRQTTCRGLCPKSMNKTGDLSTGAILLVGGWQKDPQEYPHK